MLDILICFYFVHPTILVIVCTHCTLTDKKDLCGVAIIKDIIVLYYTIFDYNI